MGTSVYYPLNETLTEYFSLISKKHLITIDTLAITVLLSYGKI